jgi:hypothetical protein
MRILRQSDGGRTTQEVYRDNQISEQTFYRRRRKYADMDDDNVCHTTANRKGPGDR